MGYELWPKISYLREATNKCAVGDPHACTFSLSAAADHI